MTAFPLTEETLRDWPLPRPEPGGKDGRGSVLLLAGSAEVPGAAILAGEAALRVGAGRLRIATAERVVSHLGLAVPEARVIGLPGGVDGQPDPRAALDRLGTMPSQATALLIGTGMTAGEGTTALTVELCRRAASKSFVLDAAALTDLRHHAETVRACEGRVILTPHAGEMARLLGEQRGSVKADPLGAASRAAALLGAVVVMKGAKTHVVDPAGKAWLFEGGCVGLAISGSGDVLAGLLAGLLGRGATPLQAALWGVVLHGSAGERLGERQGPLGFLARELAAEVPALLSRFESGSQND